MTTGKIRKALLVLACMCLIYTSTAIIYRRDAQLSSFVNLAKDRQFDCIGSVYDGQADANRLAGSCVLIGDQYVLTAWHVFKYGVDFKATRYRISYNGVSYAIDYCLPFPGEGHDIVLVKLKDKVAHIQWAGMNISDQVTGDTITMVGYGQQRRSDMSEGMLGIGVRTAAHNIIDSLGGIPITGRPSRLYADFHDYLSAASVLLPLEGMLNGGDSGGGMFILRNGKYILAGIAIGSRMTFNTQKGFDGSIMYWCNVAAYYSWIMKNMKADK